MAQSDSAWTAFKKQFKNNLAELNDMYCWSDPGFYPGKFKFNPAVGFETGFENLNPGIFPVLSEKAKGFYRFLESANPNDKEKLVRYFSFLENDFDRIFSREGLPLSLKYLAPAISAMNQQKVSADGKAGIWQLTHFQAVLNGLQVNRLVDERFNPHLSTSAFAKVMKQNFEAFETPELAVLGYLYGNTKMKNALALAGNTGNLNQILSYLPETAGMYVAAFQATSVFLQNNRFKINIDPLAKKVIPDTVQITKQVHFKQISEVLGVSQKHLEFLNPQYRYSIVPGGPKHAELALPDESWDEFVLWHDSIYNTFDSALFEITVQKIEYPPAPGRQYLGEPVKNLEIEGKTKIKYKLQTGDVLGIIAEVYDVPVEDLKYWNNISNERKIQAGKTLDIFVDNDKAAFYSGLQPVQKSKEEKLPVAAQLKQNTTLRVFRELNSGTREEHTVKNGESPFTIAKKYNGVTPEDILKWNNIQDARKIQVGQKLIIYTTK